ncbi:MAG: class 1b ribonucleoside-diphosphate reductase subunit alpha, partial [Ligilactobacillus ruminis]
CSSDLLFHQRFQPATPSFLNAGRKRRGEFVSCFLLQTTDDMNSIGRMINSALQLSRIGGGVGVNLSNLRGRGASIKQIKGAASGVVPVMKLLEDSFSYSNQLGQRQGAGAVYLNIFHPDVLEFLGTKKENADEKIRVKTLSLGLVVPDKFYELARKNEEMCLFEPYTVEKEYHCPFSYVDLTKEYEKMVENPRIEKEKISARMLEEEISKLQQESGYPYIVNIDTVNASNPIKGKIVMSNLCSEILQVQEPSVINDEQEYVKLGRDISCNLGSTNIANLMKAPDFGRSVKTMLKALTEVSDESNIKSVPSVAHGNETAHAIGLGAMGLHSFLAQNKIRYGSKEALEFVSTYFMLLNYWTLVASNEIAIEKKQMFDGFLESGYADGSYFEEYENADSTLHFSKTKELFKGIFIPSAKDWGRLRQNVMRHGLYNQNRLAVAPTGSISYINDTTASLQPIVRVVEERQEKKIGKIYYPAPGLSEETLPYYTSAYDLDMRCVIDTYAAAQKHVDQGLSLTLFMRSKPSADLYEWKKGHKEELTTRDLTILRHYAFRKKIKSIYYVRTFTDQDEEDKFAECESCVI